MYLRCYKDQESKIFLWLIKVDRLKAIEITILGNIPDFYK